MNTRFLTTTTVAGLLSLLTIAQVPAAIVSFSKADDLDFSGNFVYAVTTRDDADGLTIGDAVFTSDPNGLTGAISGHRDIQNWGGPYTFSGSVNPADDINLGVALDAIEWSAAFASEDMLITLENLTPGAEYKLQLLFAEGGGTTDRYVDVVVDGVLVEDEFNSGNALVDPRLAVVHTFFASDSTVFINFPTASTPGDHTETINALTLELVPEPTSAALLGLAGIVLAARRRRRA